MRLTKLDLSRAWNKAGGFFGLFFLFPFFCFVLFFFLKNVFVFFLFFLFFFLKTVFFFAFGMFRVLGFWSLIFFFEGRGFGRPGCLDLVGFEIFLRWLHVYFSDDLKNSMCLHHFPGSGICFL